MKKSLILYKIGKFYNAYGDDGLILHELLGYKYVEYKQMTGFPESAFIKVKSLLEKENIPFVVYEKDIKVLENKGIYKNYNTILKDALKNYDMEKRLDRLKNKINNLSLEQLEKIIEELESASI